MAQESVGSVASSPLASSALSKNESRKAADGVAAENFDSSLNSALKTQPQKLKLDKPKLGNRDPFFPNTAMPYHPDNRKPDIKVKPLEHTASMSPQVQAPMATPVQAPMSLRPMEMTEEESPIYGAELEGPEGMESTEASSGRSKKLMQKSYDGTAVTYPVRQIASESLSDDDKESLKAQGLWDAPKVVVAQPSAKLMTMAQSVEANAALQRSMVPVAQPVAQFMASLENELGVTPDRLVEAFRELPEGQLAKSPEDTMVQIIKNLNLNGKDEVEAMQIYKEMLAKMQVDEKSKDVVAKAETPAPLYFQKDVAQKYADSAQTATPAPVGQPQEGMKIADANGKGKQEAGSFEQQFSQNKAQIQDVKSDVKPGENFVAKNDAKGDVKFDSKIASKVDLKTEGKPNLQSTPLIQQVDPQISTPAVNGEGLKALEATGGTAAAANGSSARHEAIQGIINNAAALAHKGGGEMRMTLKPDHLGEIQLRVAMDGQRVDVQMTTEKTEVKKLIESGIHELKSGLAGHGLTMEKMEVSVGDKNTGTFAQNRNPDFGTAREFAQQFHQQQAARKEAFFPDAKTVKAASAQPQAPRVARQGVSSGRLNVVA